MFLFIIFNIPFLNKFFIFYWFIAIILYILSLILFSIFIFTLWNIFLLFIIKIENSIPILKFSYLLNFFTFEKSRVFTMQISILLIFWKFLNFNIIIKEYKFCNCIIFKKYMWYLSFLVNHSEKSMSLAIFKHAFLNVFLLKIY